MAKFDELLSVLHSSAGVEGTAAEKADDAIIINQDRTFTIPKDFNTTIAYEGDVNSQVVTFICPAIVEGHSLIDCKEKRLRWINKSSYTEGSSKLIATTGIEDSMILLTWEAPAEAFVKAGNLEISISFFNLVDGRIGYSWNTSILSELKVGKSLDSVGLIIEKEGQEYIPSKSEILLINTDSRQIVAPKNYNTTFCNYGDVNTSIVYFQVKRYIRGIDLLDENTIFNIHWKIQNLAFTQSSANSNSNPTKDLYAIELDNRDSEGLINIIWKPNELLTKNKIFYFGKIIIQLEIISADGRVWRTASYNELQIGKAIFQLRLAHCQNRKVLIRHILQMVLLLLLIKL